MKAPLLTMETHYDCHCPACRWARAGGVHRLALWLWPRACFAVLTLLCVAIMALAVFVLIYGFERLFHAALIFGR